MPADHLLATEQAIVCRRCGAETRPPTPIALALWVRIAREFEREHRRCVVARMVTADAR